MVAVAPIRRVPHNSAEVHAARFKSPTSVRSEGARLEVETGLARTWGPCLCHLAPPPRAAEHALSSTRSSGSPPRGRAVRCVLLGRALGLFHSARCARPDCSHCSLCPGWCARPGYFLCPARCARPGCPLCSGWALCCALARASRNQAQALRWGRAQGRCSFSTARR